MIIIMFVFGYIVGQSSVHNVYMYHSRHCFSDATIKVTHSIVIKCNLSIFVINNSQFVS